MEDSTRSPAPDASTTRETRRSRRLPPDDSATPDHRLSRRLFLGAAGAAALSAAVPNRALAAASDDGLSAADNHRWALEQDGDCYPLEPLADDEDPEAFYDWREAATKYSSEGTVDLQDTGTSLVFLYREEGEDDVYLVIVHGELNDDRRRDEGGSVSFDFRDMPEDGEWIVQDDFYDSDSNFDEWDVEDADRQVVHWTWRGGRTDGGVFGPLDDDTDLVIRPSFNEDAKLYEEYYEGDIDEWVALSGSRRRPRRIDLDLDEEIRIRWGRCDDDNDDDDDDDDDEFDFDGRSPLDVDEECTDGSGRIEITNEANRTVAVDDLEDDGDDLFRGRIRIRPGRTAVLRNVDDGRYVLQAYEPGTDREVGDDVTVRVDCEDDFDFDGRSPLDVDEECRGGSGRVEITNEANRTVAVDDLEDDGDDLFRGRIRIRPGRTAVLRNVDDGRYVLQAYEPGTDREVGDDVTVRVNCGRDDDDDDDDDDVSGNVLDVDVDCRGNGALVRVRNRSNQRVEVRDLDDRGDDLFRGRPRLGPGQSFTVSRVADGRYVLQAYELDTDREVGDDVTVRVNCGRDDDDDDDDDDVSGNVLDVDVDCRGNGALVRVRNRSNQRVEVRDLDDRGDDLFRGRPRLGPGESFTVSRVADGRYVVQAYEPGTSRRVGDPVTVRVNC